ncbi:hypothetical protein RHGRI_027012 [Rhododendron griersonianum]|uniref:Uncharacterized protein n=1 Tax=Rhododendron griersonianum TaxID=479676 RepID=A0AAV6IYB1_9ERIC|nr:hypothetical protein RHGRI_027012 [Rhododendron griersonianum]
MFMQCKTFVDLVATQCSQVNDRIRGNKGKAKEVVDVGIREHIHESDTNDYDPDSMFSHSGGEDFNESDNGLEDDDALFDINVGKGVEYGGLGSTCDPNDPEYAPVGKELTHLHDLADLDG